MPVRAVPFVLAELLLAAGRLPGAQAAIAQPQDTLRIPRLSAPIVFDGMPNERAWDEISPLPLSVFSPVFRAAPTERTEIRVAYDDTYFYASGRMYDSDPKGIRVNTYYRDRYSGDDLLGVLLDTYADHQTASWFVMNPAGVRTDRALSNDAEFSQGEPMNPNWNTFWDAATARTADGWFAEMRIPFSSLGFQDAHGRVVMGIGVYRFIARKNERHAFPAIPPSYGPLAFAKPSRFTPMVLEGVHRRQPVYVTPYALGGASRAAALDAAGTGYRFADDVTHEGGLDLRLSPTSNLTLDLTANTDFAQVEADDQQINLTRFSLFFPEKRQFFQERGAIFDFSLGDFDRLFHSRRIGLVEEVPIRLLGGARLVGRLGGMDLGLIDMQTAAERGLATENLGVLRLKQRVLNANSTLGAMLTHRVRGDGAYNVAAGLDAVIRTFGDHYLTIKLAQTVDDSLGTGAGGLEGTRMLARFERRNLSGPSYTQEVIRSGSRYLPGLGFNLRNDNSSSETRFRYQRFGTGQAPFRSIAMVAAGKVWLRNGDRSVESALIDPNLNLELKTGGQLTLTYRASYESVRDSFDLSGGTPVPPGDYWFREGELRYMAPMSATFRPTFGVALGQFYDGSRFSVGVNPAWNPISRLELGLDYQFNQIRFSDRGLKEDLHVARVRIQTAYDAHLSLSTFLQYVSSGDAASVNARVRYNFREGRDLWLVYNETVNTDRGGLIPEPPFSQSRALMLKYTHALIW